MDNNLKIKSFAPEDKQELIHEDDTFFIVAPNGLKIRVTYEDGGIKIYKHCLDSTSVKVEMLGSNTFIIR